VNYLEFSTIIGELKIINRSMKTLLLLHGALGCSDDLISLKARLEKEGLNVHTLGFSGHGKSAFKNAFGIPQFSGELAEYIEKNNLTRPTVFGYSMGGYVALNAASQINGIGKIITLGTKFNWSNTSVEKEMKMLDPKVISEKVPAFSSSLQAKHGEKWKELLSRTASLMREINEKQFLAPEVIKTLDLPILVGLGDSDQMVSLEETTNVYKALPKAGMYMLPKTKHLLESANLNILTNIIADFVTQD
jgi:pimeloyl-ACP methyl ester carboxylesterase